MAMSYVRFKSVLGNMTTAAQKVYSAIPSKEYWTYDEVNRELARLGSHMEYRTMQGCINSLCQVGLAREAQERGRFMRTEVRGKPAKPLRVQEEEATSDNTEEEVMTVKKVQAVHAAATATVPVKNPVDMLGELAAKTRALSAQLNSLAMEIDSAALAAQDYVEHSDKDTEKLRQLQAVLKGLM